MLTSTVKSRVSIYVKGKIELDIRGITEVKEGWSGIPRLKEVRPGG
jgi:hypothetical protein